MTLSPVNTVPVDDVRLAFRESGSGYPVILINGLASTMDMWNPPVLAKISEHFRVIIFDSRGTGYSGSSGKPISISLLARDTAGLMDALGISSAHVIGLSMGASIAEELAIGFPEKTDRLVLVSGNCGGSESVRTQADVVAQLLDKSGTACDVAIRMFSLLFPPLWLDTHDPFSYCPEVYETTSEEMVARQATAFFGWTGSFPRLLEIRSPTLIITGTDDTVVPRANSRILSGRIPGAELVEIPGAGHGLMYQFPDQFSDCVLVFLDR
ncbi:alpha/beta fold hydrolase [Methanoregula sp.]|uniref:alpha/beta fold hydrolase n=1 Tax=Methanoregula sp. TaxID=2052170 RepID=UPI003C73EF2B